MGGFRRELQRFPTIPSHPFLEETYPIPIRILVNIRTEIIPAKHTGRIWEAGGQNSQTLEYSESGEARTDSAQTPGSGVWSDVDICIVIAEKDEVPQFKVNFAEIDSAQRSQESGERCGWLARLHDFYPHALQQVGTRRISVRGRCTHHRCVYKHAIMSRFYRRVTTALGYQRVG